MPCPARVPPRFPFPTPPSLFLLFHFQIPNFVAQILNDDWNIINSIFFFAGKFIVLRFWKLKLANKRFSKKLQAYYYFLSIRYGLLESSEVQMIFGENS